MTQYFFDMRKQCKLRMNQTNSKELGEKFRKSCGVIWDGILCWPETESGVLQSQPCPEYFGFSPKENATKKCTENGTWYFSEERNTTWSNYTLCKKLLGSNTAMVTIKPPLQNLSLFYYWIPKIKIISRIGYGISITTLLLAIAIFIFVKKLHCARNSLHLNLFLSFFLKAFLTLLKDGIFFGGISPFDDMISDGSNNYVKEHHYWFCKALISLWNYSITTSNTLVLMEGIYLHNLLYLTLYSDNNDIYLYVILGWGLPICFILPWIILKAIFDNEYCWTLNRNSNCHLLLQIPTVISVLINFILFIRIILILIRKLDSMFVQQRRIKYRRLIRSTMILILLFGIPHMLSIMAMIYTSMNQTFELLWMFFDQIFTSLQGFFVALLYCLMNNEVRNEMKRLMHKQERHLRTETIRMSNINIAL